MNDKARLDLLDLPTSVKKCQIWILTSKNYHFSRNFDWTYSSVARVILRNVRTYPVSS